MCVTPVLSSYKVGVLLADAPACSFNEEDADTSLMEEIAEAEAAYEPPDIDFAANSEFPIEPFSLREEREVVICCPPHLLTSMTTKTHILHS